jgi:hypothetical protein
MVAPVVAVVVEPAVEPAAVTLTAVVARAAVRIG